MGVQKDAGELLLFFYNELINKGKDMIETQEILNETSWEGKRLNNAFLYLYDNKLIKSEMCCGNSKGAINFIIERLYPLGINIIENKENFKKQFNFEVNLGLLKFSWGASEK